jgi:succinate-acetate transporter protein
MKGNQLEGVANEVLNGTHPALQPDNIARIVLRPSASPMPLGFFTIAIATCVLSSLQTHIIPLADRQSVAYVVLPAFVLQLIVAIFALMDRDTVAATVMASFATTWLIDTLILIKDPPGARQTLAVFFLVFSAFVVMMAIAAFPKRALFAVLIVAVPRFLASGLAQATGTAWVSTLAGVLGFALAAVSLYTAWALLLEDVRGKTVLPIGREGAARTAIEGDLAAQLRGIEHAAGVRRSL